MAQWQTNARTVMYSYGNQATRQLSLTMAMLIPSVFGGNGIDWLFMNVDQDESDNDFFED